MFDKYSYCYLWFGSSTHLLIGVSTEYGPECLVQNEVISMIHFTLRGILTKRWYLGTYTPSSFRVGGLKFYPTNTKHVGIYFSSY